VQRPHDGGRNAAGLAADVQRFAIVVFHDVHAAAIAGDPPARFRGNVFALGELMLLPSESDASRVPCGRGASPDSR
jgi:hypothetical protein